MNHTVKRKDKIVDIDDLNIGDMIECVKRNELVFDEIKNIVSVQCKLVTICIDGIPKLELPLNTLLGIQVNGHLCYAYVEEYPKSLLLKSATIYLDPSKKEIPDADLMSFDVSHYLTESSHNILRYLDLCIKNNIKTIGCDFDDLYHKLNKATLHGKECSISGYPFVKCNHLSYRLSSNITYTKIVMKKYNTYFRNNILIYDPE